MVCLRCGWCCRNIWPGNQNEELKDPIPCPNLIQFDGDIAICRIYPDRPKQCRDEHMGAGDGEPCMIGLQALDSGKIPRPKGKCMNCGEPRFSDDNAPFCSEECAKGTIDDLNAFIKRGCKDED